MKTKDYIAYAQDVELFSQGLFTYKDLAKKDPKTKTYKEKEGTYLLGYIDVQSLLGALGHDMDNTFDSCSCAVISVSADEDGNVNLRDGFSFSPAFWAFEMLIQDSGAQLTIENKKETDAELWKAVFGIEDEGNEDHCVTLDEVFHHLDRIQDHLEKQLKLTYDKIVWSSGKDAGSGLTAASLMKLKRPWASFYKESLEAMAAETPSPKVEAFIAATNQEYAAKDTVEIDSDATALQSVNAFQNMALGRWPSKYMPSLMQQTAINIITQEAEDVVAINGPPGTGKTTLLKEVIAANIVKRADAICSLCTAPDKAFTKKKSSRTGTSYYIPDSRITGYGILVASSNNAAVENISKELPLFVDGHAPTGLYEQGPSEVDYFSETACAVVKGGRHQEEGDAGCWALLSVPLGKSDNIAAAIEALNGLVDDDDYKSLGYSLEHEEIDFKSARNEFAKAKAELEAARAGLASKYKGRLDTFYANAAETRKAINIKGLLKRDRKPSDDALIERWEEAQNGFDYKLEDPDYKDFNRLREKLFWKALKIHKAFLCNSDAVKSNLMLFYEQLQYGKKRDAASYCHLLNTFFLAVPVVSTTFASAHRLLDKLPPDSIGYLIIDEAGQAQPYYALECLEKAKMAVVVGDPFQIEPIETLPAGLDEFLRLRHGISQDDPRRPRESVQTAADRMSKYIGKRKYKDKELDVGCPLIIHRRCLEPMFSISNAIAYQNTMINKTREPGRKDFILESSCWIDVQGKEDKKDSRNVPAQIECVKAMLRKNKDKLSGNAPGEARLFIISPFTSVVKALHDEADRFGLRHDMIGTVHTFQGKQADEVIIVLGCDNKSKGSADWVGEKPNMMNVAISRAKYKVAVIGDQELWRNIGCVAAVQKKLMAFNEEAGKPVSSKEGRSASSGHSLAYVGEFNGKPTFEIPIDGTTIRFVWDMDKACISKTGQERLNAIDPSLAAIVTQRLEAEASNLIKAGTAGSSNTGAHDVKTNSPLPGRLKYIGESSAGGYLDLVYDDGGAHAKFSFMPGRGTFDDKGFKQLNDIGRTEEIRKYLESLDVEGIKQLGVMKPGWKASGFKANGDWLNFVVTKNGHDSYRLGWNCVEKRFNRKDQAALEEKEPSFASWLVAKLGKAGSEDDVRRILEGLGKDDTSQYGKAGSGWAASEYKLKGDWIDFKLTLDGRKTYRLGWNYAEKRFNRAEQAGLEKDEPAFTSYLISKLSEARSEPDVRRILEALSGGLSS